MKIKAKRNFAYLSKIYTTNFVYEVDFTKKDIENLADCVEVLEEEKKRKVEAERNKMVKDKDTQKK